MDAHHMISSLKHLVTLRSFSLKHSQLVLVSNFIAALEEVKLQHSELYEPLKSLSDLFALYLIEKELGDFCEDGYVTVQQAGMVREQVRQLLGVVRRGAVGLVDAWAFSDVSLNSALGRYVLCCASLSLSLSPSLKSATSVRYDGNVYEALYAMAQREPLNAKQVPDGYEQLLQPLIKSSL